MKNLCRNWMLASAVLALAALGATAQAQEGMGFGPHRPPMEKAMGPGSGMAPERGRWWNDPRVVEKLKLTDAQKKTMDDIYQQHRLKLVDLHAALQKEELTMEPLIRADQPDEGKILSQIDRVAQARAELEKANARMLFELRRQLSAEQWKTLQEERSAHREHFGAGPEGRDGWRDRERGFRGPGQGQPRGPAGPGASSPPPPAASGPNPGPGENGPDGNGPGAEE
jgi:periplasmic protein CpxP/Spy